MNVKCRGLTRQMLPESSPSAPHLLSPSHLDSQPGPETVTCNVIRTLWYQNLQIDLCSYTETSEFETVLQAVYVVNI